MQTKTPAQEAAASRQFAVEVARLLSNTRCSNVALLDVTGISPVTDFLVLGTGRSPRQMKTAADDAQEFGEPRNFRALSRVGDSNGQWIVVDFVHVVVHVFSADARQFYNLDGLWGDARKLEWREENPRTDHV